MSPGNKRMLSRAFFFAAILAFLVFHLVSKMEPYRHEPKMGWEIWPDLWKLLAGPLGRDPVNLMAVGLFLGCVLLILAAPFMEKVWLSSKPAWITCVFFSGVTTAAIWFLLVVYLGLAVDRLTGLLFASVTLNFLGLATARAGASSLNPFAPSSANLPESGR